MSAYADFLDAKSQGGADSGFAPLWMPDSLFDFQRDIGAELKASYYRQAVKNVSMAAAGRKDIEENGELDLSMVTQCPAA